MIRVQRELGEEQASTAFWYFKLFNSIKEFHEIDFAELELRSLFGNITPVRNFSDILSSTPFGIFIDESVRVQDLLAHELPYGSCHGFLGNSALGKKLIERLMRRLAYTREFFIVTDAPFCAGVGVEGKNFQSFRSGSHLLLRFITNQYFLEKSQYISKLSRNEKEAERNIEALLNFLTRNSERIPASSTMSVGKRLEDYFAIREEPSLYLTHYMHPYKGKFHPKMVRALLNCIYPRDEGLVMDNFAGSGTLLVEASLLSLDSVGIEINPLSVLMSNVKCESLSYDPVELREVIKSFLDALRVAQVSLEQEASSTMHLSSPAYDIDRLKMRRSRIQGNVRRLFPDPNLIDRIILAHEVLLHLKDENFADFLLLGLSGAISDSMRRRRSGEFLDVLEDRLYDLYLRIYIFHRLNDVLRIRLGKSKTYTMDTKEMNGMEADSVDAILNSPPYSTALDYVRNDLPQLALLELADINSLEQSMMGHPNFKKYQNTTLSELTDTNTQYSSIPSQGRTAIQALVSAGRGKEAIRAYRFFIDMRRALEEMHRVMKPGAKCAVIIGNNHFKLNGYYQEVRNDDILLDMAEKIGFEREAVIKRELEKSLSGMIRYESVLLLQKGEGSQRA